MKQEEGERSSRIMQSPLSSPAGDSIHSLPIHSLTFNPVSPHRINNSMQKINCLLSFMYKCCCDAFIAAGNSILFPFDAEINILSSKIVSHCEECMGSASVGQQCSHASCDCKHERRSFIYIGRNLIQEMLQTNYRWLHFGSHATTHTTDTQVIINRLAFTNSETEFNSLLIRYFAGTTGRSIW
jgi:hypothetical protein